MITEKDAPASCNTITCELIALLRSTFRLDWDGIHGVAHWARVRSNGLLLAARNGANTRVIEYFSFLHDVCRHNDGKDPDHGSRAALFADHIRDRHIALTNHEFALLRAAIASHTSSTYHESLTVLTCWDADRLDLLRVGIVPVPQRLNTAEAMDPAVIASACKNARAWTKAYLERESR